MKVREDYIEKKQRFLYDKKRMKENFDREIERIIQENKEMNESLKGFEGFKYREHAVEGNLHRVQKTGVKGELTKHLEKFSCGAELLDWKEVEKKLDSAFNGGKDFALEDLLRFLSFKVLQTARDNVRGVRNDVKCAQGVGIMRKELSLKGFDTKTSLNSMYY